MGGGVLRGDAVRFEGCDDRPIGTVLDVCDEDLAVPQTRGLAAGDGSRRVGADFLDDGVASRSRDRQDRGCGVLAQTLSREGTDASEARLSAVSHSSGARSEASAHATSRPRGACPSRDRS